MYGNAPNRENFAFGRTWSTLLRSKLSYWVGFLVWFWVCLCGVVFRDEFPRTWSLLLLNWFGEEWNTSLTKSQRSRAGIPSMRKPAPIEIISASVELWETEVGSLHIQLIGTSVSLPNMHNSHPDVDFESSGSLAKSESWNHPNLHCCAVFPTWQYCLNAHVWWMYEINRFRRLSKVLVHFVIDRASFFTDHKIWGLPIRAKHKHFRTIWEHDFDNSPTDFVSSSLKGWSSMHGVDTL